MVGEGALERQSVHGKDEGNTLIPAGGRGGGVNILIMVMMEKGKMKVLPSYYLLAPPSWS